MDNITKLKDKVSTKTGNMLLLTFATAGIYPILWIWENRKHIDETTRTNTISNTSLIWMLACQGWGTTLYIEGDEALMALSGLFSLALMVLYVLWAFEARKALQEYAFSEFNIYLPMNRFYTVFLSVYYINYCINDLPEVVRKQRSFSNDVNRENSD